MREHFGDDQSIRDAKRANDISIGFVKGLDNIAAWNASAGRLQSVDLRFNGQVIVNPESNISAHAGAAPGAKPWTPLKP